jgi:putative flippase GtrA
MKNLKVRLITFLKAYIHDKKFLYIINGSIIFGINLILAYLIFKIPFSKNSQIQNNVANIITTELMVIISFFIHDNFTWKGNTGSFFYKIFRYHTIMAGSLILRFIAFYIFDTLGLHFLVSTVLSIAIIIVFNYFGFDKYVFDK